MEHVKQSNPEARITQSQEEVANAKGMMVTRATPWAQPFGKRGTTVKVVAAAALLGGLALMGSQKWKGMNGLSPTPNPSTSNPSAGLSPSSTQATSSQPASEVTSGISLSTST